MQYYRHFRRHDFTEIFIAHEVEDVDAITTEEKERHGKILDQFILAYRAFTSAVRMPNDLVGEYPLIRFGVHHYTDEELRRPEHERVSELRDAGVRIEGVPLRVLILMHSHHRLLTPKKYAPLFPLSSRVVKLSQRLKRS